MVPDLVVGAFVEPLHRQLAERPEDQERVLVEYRGKGVAVEGLNAIGIVRCCLLAALGFALDLALDLALPKRFTNIETRV